MVIHRQIHIPTTVSLFRIRKSVVCFSVGIGFYNREWFQGFRQNRQAINMNRDFAYLSFENCAANPNKIPDIQ